jgi:predicted amidophosphoribosyltransferase
VTVLVELVIIGCLIAAAVMLARSLVRATSCSLRGAGQAEETTVCKQCRKENPSHAQFCSRCGEPLQS